MKVLKLKQALHEIAADIDKAITTSSAESLSVRHNRLLGELIRTRKRLQDLEFPARNDEELERDLLAVRQFVESMTVSEGAVTCANIYNARFFELDRDRRFLVQLSTYLVKSYSKASPLIESTFRLWASYAKS